MASTFNGWGNVADSIGGSDELIIQSIRLSPAKCI